jgi:hypothetical protein
LPDRALLAALPGAVSVKVSGVRLACRRAAPGDGFDAALAEIPSSKRAGNLVLLLNARLFAEDLFHRLALGEFVD